MTQTTPRPTPLTDAIAPHLNLSHQDMYRTATKLRDHARQLERDRAELMEALVKANVALDDWINTYASEMCDGERVKEAYARISEAGGTLAYIADIRQKARALLKRLKP